MTGTPVKPVRKKEVKEMTRKECGNMTIQQVKAIFAAKKEANEEERKREFQNKLPKPTNPRGLAAMVFAFLDAEAESFIACGGTPRYQITERQLFYLKWYENAYPTTELSALIKEAEHNPVCIYDWRNLQVLLTELVEDFKIAREVQEEEPEINFDAVPPHIKARLEAKIK